MHKCASERPEFLKPQASSLPHLHTCSTPRLGSSTPRHLDTSTPPHRLSTRAAASPRASATPGFRVVRMPRFSNGNGPNDPYRLSHPTRTIEHMFDHRTTTEPTPEEPDGRSRTSADAAVEVAAAGGVRVCSGSFEVLLEQFIRVVDAMGQCVVPADSAALIALRAQVDRVSALITEAEVRFDAAELWRDEGAGSMRAFVTP